MQRFEENFPAYVAAYFSNRMASSEIVQEKGPSVVAIGRNDWETRVFGYKAGNLDFSLVEADGDNLIPTSIEAAKRSQFEYIICKVYSSDVETCNLLTESGFVIVDAVIDYAWHASQEASVRSSGVLIREAGRADQEALEKMMRESFESHFGRFYGDPNLRPHAARVYASWIEASLNGYADRILAAEVDGRIAGTSVWKLGNAMERQYLPSLAHYSIGAVHPDFAGRGVFKALTSAGARSLFEAGAAWVEGPTHIANTPVQKAYIDLGWKPTDARYTLHKWL